VAINMVQDEAIEVPGAPEMPGLRFRRFRGESDFPAMVGVFNASRAADGLDEVRTVEQMAQGYANLKNSDPYQDLVLIEVDGQVVGYKRIEWWAELDGTHIYSHFGFMLPQVQGKGIGKALIRHSEARLREIAAGHPREKAPLFDTWTVDRQTGLIELLKSEGYEPVRYGYDMVRPDLENIPDMPLPEGIEARPVKPEQYRAIWEAEVEAFKDHWGEAEVEEKDFTRWQNDPMFQPHLWQVAWDGDQVVGMVRNFVNEEENTQFGRKRGYTEYISVRRPWRKRGVARALIARSFKLHKELGMEEAALGVDAQNPNGALQLYESMGFQTRKVWTAFRKPLV